MIRTINICVNAAHPELPIAEATTYVGSPSAVFVRGVPKGCGSWSITAVKAVAHYPDDSATTVQCVRAASGVWVATLPATATSGRVTHGLEILADGIDEAGSAVTGYVLGVADFTVFTRDMTIDSGGTLYYVHGFATVPDSPKDWDMAPDGSGGFQIYLDGAWHPLGSGGSAPVQSVNGKTGVVVLSASDVGALPASSVVVDDGLSDIFPVTYTYDGTDISLDIADAAFAVYANSPDDIQTVIVDKSRNIQVAAFGFLDGAFREANPDITNLRFNGAEPVADISPVLPVPLYKLPDTAYPITYEEDGISRSIQSAEQVFLLPFYENDGTQDFAYVDIYDRLADIDVAIFDQSTGVFLERAYESISNLQFNGVEPVENLSPTISIVGKSPSVEVCGLPVAVIGADISRSGVSILPASAYPISYTDDGATQIINSESGVCIVPKEYGGEFYYYLVDAVRETEIAIFDLATGAFLEGAEDIMFGGVAPVAGSSPTLGIDNFSLPDSVFPVTYTYDGTDYTMASEADGMLVFYKDRPTTYVVLMDEIGVAVAVFSTSDGAYVLSPDNITNLQFNGVEPVVGSSPVLSIKRNIKVLDVEVAPLASPAFTGTPTAPTPTSGDDSTKVATTAFVQAAMSGVTPNLDYVMRVDPETGNIYYTTPDTNA